MATMVIYTTLDLPKEEKAAFYDALGSATTAAMQIPPNKFSIIWSTLPPENFTARGGREIVNVFAYSAPGKSRDLKRAFHRAVKDAFEQRFGKDTMEILVIIKEHADENVGVNGEMRADATAR